MVSSLVSKISSLEALKIFEYSMKPKQDYSMTQSPANLVPRVSWPSDTFTLERGECFDLNHSLGCVYPTLYTPLDV